MTNPFFGTVTTFGKAYPEVESLKFTGTETGDLRNGDWEQNISCSESSLPETIPCGNPRCQQGGYSLRAILITITHSRDAEFDGSMSCKGHEGTPKGRRKGNSCCNRLKYKLEVKYKKSADIT